MTAAAQTDRYGLPLSTSAEAADAFGTGLDTVLALAEGAQEHFARAIALDPGFALGHAALALLGFEQGVRTDCAARLAAARRATGTAGPDGAPAQGGSGVAARCVSERELSFLHAVEARVADPDGACDSDGPGSRAILQHIERFPRDAFMVCVAVPTVAFGGVTHGRQTWDLVERLRPVYGNDWWYSGQLAFVRQSQSRWDEAEELSVRALSQNPSAGHAVHARAHVFYETGAHAAGLTWLDGWIRRFGPRANSRAHFSWHAAVHELALDDGAAVRRRYREQLAPPLVTGPRALVDSGALLWKQRVAEPWQCCPEDRYDLAGQGRPEGRPADRILDAAANSAIAAHTAHGALDRTSTNTGTDTASAARLADASVERNADARAVLDAAPVEWLAAPPSPFATMHAAIALALASDAPRLAALARYAERHAHHVVREVAAPLCDGLLAIIEERWNAAARLLTGLLPRVGELQGSAAQLEVVEDSLLLALIESGRTAEAAVRLTERLDRRESPRDRRRLAALTATPGLGELASAGAGSH